MPSSPPPVAAPPWPEGRPEEAGTLAAGELRLWWCPAQANDDGASRRQRLDALLRRLLAPTLGLAAEALPFRREDKGRPWLDHPLAADFNLSDTDGGRLVAITRDARVGVDLERLDRQPPVLRLARRWFSANEAEALSALPEDAARLAFLRLWTAKEASCKATGTGIYGYLPQWTFEAAGESPRLTGLPREAGGRERWSFLRVRPSEQHTAVLALRDAGPLQVQAFTLALT